MIIKPYPSSGLSLIPSPNSPYLCPLFILPSVVLMGHIRRQALPVRAFVGNASSAWHALPTDRLTTFSLRPFLVPWLKLQPSSYSLPDISYHLALVYFSLQHLTYFTSNVFILLLSDQNLNSMKAEFFCAFLFTVQKSSWYITDTQKYNC